MQLTVTVADPMTQAHLDLFVDVDTLTTVGELAAELTAQLRDVDDRKIASLDAHRAGGVAQATRLYVDGLMLDSADLLTDSPVRDGSLVSFDDPALSTVAEPLGAQDLRIVSGPGAGVVHRLSAGEATVGSGPACAVRLDVEGVPELAFTLRVPLHGPCTVHPADGVELQLEHEVVEDEREWEEGACLLLGDSLLELRHAASADAALQPSVDGLSLDYNRPPRLLPPLRKTRYQLPSPPVEPRGRQLPWIAIFAPMVMAAVMVFALGNVRYALFAFMSPVMAIGNFVSGRSGSRKTYKADLETYQSRTAQIQQDARDALVAERLTRRSQAPDPAEVLLIAAGPRARLWERRRDDPDYLSLRLGTADQPSEVTLEDPEQLSHRRDVTWQALDAPVTVSLSQRGVVGVAGRSELTGPLAAWLVAQTAVLHSPRDVQVYVLTDGAARDRWDWLRWLPHCRPSQGQDAVVLLGSDTDSQSRRIGELQAMVQARSAARSSAEAATVDDPDVLVVLDGARRLRFLPGIVQVLKDGPKVGIFALCIDADERLLPEECSAVVVQTGPSTVTVRQQRLEVVADARADIVPASWFGRVSRALAPVKDVTDDGAESALPNGCRLLDVLDLEPPTGQGVMDAWLRGGRTTEAVVGMSLDGSFALDLRRDGPHALIAGTTGAGKSELLQTLVASLAVANRPDAMTFVLIDYKGGSAFKDCVNLPHTVGMVTDLDTHLVERALESLAAELHRREHILAAAGAKDIEDYTDLGTKDSALAPLPRLCIVIDEFASMVRELPDFVAGLVNIAQRGRSLGIHLILATQRPSGVVSPEIRANTNLRIALRVTDKSESTDVVDAPDAALISKATPGRAYVRLGHASLVPFQAGRVGGRRPGAQDTATERPVPFLVPLDWNRLGHPVPTRPRGTEPETDAAATDLGALVHAVIEANEAMGIPAQHSPWLSALTGTVMLDDLPAYDGPERALPPVPWAVADLPSQQARRPEVIDLSTLGHKYIIGAARSGRTQALRTIAAAVGASLSARDVHLYGIDCGSGGLLPLTALPHCGAIVQRTQTDRVTRLLSRLVEEVTHRQEVLAQGGYASLTEQRSSVNEPDRLPHLLLLLDRWEGYLASLSELDGGKLHVMVMTLLNEGASVGIHLIVSGDRSLGSYRLAAITEDKLVLRMADKADYSAVGLNTRSLPDTVPDGRGFQPDGNIETQIAVLDGPATGQGQAAAIAVIGARATERDAAVPRSHRPFRIDVLPGMISYDDAVALAGDLARRPALWAMLGVGGDDLDAMGPDLGRSPVVVLAGPPRSGRSTALVTMTRSLLERGTPVVLIAPRISPLRDLAGHPGVRGCLAGDVLLTEELQPLLEPTGPLVIVMDDAELHKETKAAEALKAFMRTASDRGRAMIVGGGINELASGYTGWHAEARKARAGALLCPQTPTDGELIGVRLPRSLVGEPVKPGRAHLSTGTGLVTLAVPRLD